MSEAAERLRHRALGLLARREHARAELERKLRAKGFDGEDVAQCVGELEAAGLLSDARFAESYLRARVAAGCGPIRIAQELRERGVEGPTIERTLADCEEDWRARMAAVREKRFGAGLPREQKQRMRQARFLQYKGFAADQIRRLLSGTERDD